MKKVVLTLVIAFFGITLFAQRSDNAVLVIQTNGVCEKCETKFKENVPFFKGVVDCSYDQKTSKLTVVYSTKKTTPDEIRESVSKLGYDADQVKADAKAREKLPACCKVQKGTPAGCGHNHSGCGHKH